jgi:hypothetical protein
MRTPTGRYERRMAKAEAVELLRSGKSPTVKVKAITENVSSTGARVIINSTCSPGELVRLGAPEERLSLPAQVVYCQRLEESKFAVGLLFDGRVEKWRNPGKS